MNPNLRGSGTRYPEPTSSPQPPGPLGRLSADPPSGAEQGADHSGGTALCSQPEDASSSSAPLSHPGSLIDLLEQHRAHYVREAQ